MRTARKTVRNFGPWLSSPFSLMIQMDSSLFCVVNLNSPLRTLCSLFMRNNVQGICHHSPALGNFREQPHVAFALAELVPSVKICSSGALPPCDADLRRQVDENGNLIPSDIDRCQEPRFESQPLTLRCIWIGRHS